LRLERLELSAYRNLENFEINFDDAASTFVLLGRNGTGKSYLIEAIVEIFRDLEAQVAPTFAYRLTYTCRGKRIKIVADPSRRARRMTYEVDGIPLSVAEFRDGLDTWLPTNVFAYYSGWSSRLEHQFDRPTRRHYEELRDNEDAKLPLRRLFFCRKDYSQLVLLAFFLTKSSESRKLLRDYLSIETLESVLFVLKRPWWGGRRTPTKIQAEQGDPRFWWARGAFKGFLQRLWAGSLAPLHNTEPVERDVRRQPEATDRLYLYFPSESSLADLRKGNENAKTVFAYLEGLFLSDLIDEVRVTVRRSDGRSVGFAQLSEGEQQLLTVLGLLIFTQNDESLYLLDEPDTHLNPVWTYDYLELLRSHLKAAKGQLLVSTHNPLMVGTVYRDQVRIFSREAAGIIAVPPTYDPIGIGIEGLLKSDLFGLRSTLAPDILAKLDRHYLLMGKPKKTRAELDSLMKLSNELNALGVSRTHPNPYFEAFAEQLAKRQPNTATVRTTAEIEGQMKIVEEIFSEVLPIKLDAPDPK
jgi:predicted ATPase